VRVSRYSQSGNSPSSSNNRYKYWGCRNRIG
jgi:hypothetical protein